VRDDQYQEAVVQRSPAQYAVLAQGPLLMQAFFEVNQIAALAQPHFLGETGNLIQIGREISDSPNAGLRKIVKFHASAHSACRK
jgi:hypothetical protein